jgi:uncharacterized protein YwqG
MDRNELENALRQQCPTIGERVIAALEPCVVLEVAGIGDVAVGGSKLGGAPDMPKDMDWPAWEKGPLTFLAQIDLSALGVDTDLPSTGRLLFFADVDRCFGLYPEDRDGFRVMWTDAHVEPRPAPADVEEFACGRLTPRPRVSIPPLGSRAVDLHDVDVPDEEADALEEIREQWGVYETHQLLGHAAFIQHPIEEEVVQAIHGCFSGSTRFDTDTWKRVEHETADWRLLLQIASDGKLDYMWGDAGLLYFAIRRDALERPDSGHAWYLFQSS